MVINAGLRGLRPRGTMGLVGPAPQELDQLAFTTKRLVSIYEGDAGPQLFIPQLISLWRQGRFPFDRLVQTYPLEDINQAETDASSGAVIKPVLVPGG